MIAITIEPLSAANQGDLNHCDNSFTVKSELHLSAGEGRIHHSEHAVAPYLKRYDPEVFDAQEYIGRTDRAAWLAYAGSQVAGQILVQEHWNRLAIVWDIAVSPPYRRQGVGSRLIRQAIAWARECGLPGIMLETQNVNVGACRLYESCGFVLGGFDTYLYKGIAQVARETALFYYLMF